MKSMALAESYQNKKTVQEQIIEIITFAYQKAIGKADVIFCTSQMEHILSRALKEMGVRLEETGTLSWIISKSLYQRG